MPVKLVSAHRTGGHGDTGDHAAAHVGDEGNQTASIVPNTPANTIHALFCISADMESLYWHCGRKWLDSCHFSANMGVFRGALSLGRRNRGAAHLGRRRRCERWYGGRIPFQHAGEGISIAFSCYHVYIDAQKHPVQCAQELESLPDDAVLVQEVSKSVTGIVVA